VPSNNSQPWKALARRFRNLCRFPGVRIGPGSSVSVDSRVALGTVVGSNSHVFQSQLGVETVLGDDVIVGHRSHVARSSVGRACIIETDIEIFNSTLADFVGVQAKCLLNHTRVGRYSYIARETQLNDVSIGAFASIGPQTLIGCGDHPSNFVSTAPVFYSTRRQCGTSFATADGFVERKPVVIGNDVWLGARVFVRDGVTIGDGAIVAAGSIVTKDVAPYAIVGGVPAKLIRLRFSDDEVKQLLALQWWNWDEARLRAAQPFLGRPAIAEFLRWAKA
jgi:acetyltransferase-like isoleucine patch superfamily enzyme